MKWLRLLIRLLLAILLCLNIYIIVMGELMGSTALNRLPVALLPVVSDSMKPKLKSGDAIVTTQTDFNELKIGDIIVYYRDEELIVHEIIGRENGMVITKGIANPIADLPVSKEDYRARVIFRIPLLGGIWRILSTPLGTIVFLVLLILLIFGDRIFSYIYLRLFDRNEESQETKHN